MALIFIIFVAIILVGIWIAKQFENKCPKCGADLIEWDSHPWRDYCPNGCKFKRKV